MTNYTPIPFVAPSAKSEIIGRILLGWLFKDALHTDIELILKKHGLDQVDPDRWYPMQKILDIYKDIFHKSENVSMDIVAMGMNTTEIVLPAEINGIEQAIGYTNEIVQRSCRNVPPDFGFLLTAVGEGHLLVKNNVPFAPEGLYGYLWQVVKKLKLPDDVFVIRELPRSANDPVTFEIKWGPDEESIS